MNDKDKKMLHTISDIDDLPSGAYNIRKDGVGISRNITENINIETKDDMPGINVYVKENTMFESVHIPVLLTKSGLNDLVYNDFYVGKNATVVIIAGCGIHNDDHKTSEHDGIHRFFLESGSRVKYIEKHYGEGKGDGKKILNPITEIHLKNNATLEMETSQIKGVDSTIRETKAYLEENSTLTINEHIYTHGNQTAETRFEVHLDGEGSSANVTSRSVASEDSKQIFISNIQGNNKCFSHVECDAIILDNATVTSIPEITANNVNANLIHEAAIGKIAGEQIIKLMTLGLTEKEAEQQIITGFLK